MKFPRFYCVSNSLTVEIEVCDPFKEKKDCQLIGNQIKSMKFNFSYKSRNGYILFLHLPIPVIDINYEIIRSMKSYIIKVKLMVEQKK